MKKISILIPVYNAGSNWLEALENIDNQSITPNRKIIIDSGSTDNTVLLAKKFGYEILTINKKDFDHGYARQLLAEAAADSDILVFLTQDCILANPQSLVNLIAAFDDEKVGIAYGRQLPRQGAKILEAHARNFNYPEISVTKSIENKKEMGIKTASCSNSFAAYRKTALNEVGGFPLNSIFGEDVIVGGLLLINGWKIAYIGNATGYHSHDYTVLEEFKRYFDVGVFHQTNHWLLDEFGSASGEGLKYVKSELKCVIKNNIFLLPKMTASVLAKWLGYKLGLNYLRLPNNLKKGFSMHKSYWYKQERV